jgi:hypothetical protein
MSPPNNTNSAWDPSVLRLNDGEITRRQGDARRTSRYTIEGKFIKGPVDVRWICRASRLGVKALLVGLALWHLKGLRTANAIIVSNLMLRDWGILPDAKWRALRKLEAAGLIRIERRGKRSPQVMITGGIGMKMPDQPADYSDCDPDGSDASCAKEAA